MCRCLTHIILASFFGTCSNSAQKVASDRGIKCLLKECSIKILINMENNTLQPLKREWTDPVDNNGNSYSA